MGTTDKLAAHKRDQKRVPAGAKPVRRITVPVCNETLKKIRIWYYEKTRTGLVSLDVESGKEIRRGLVYTVLAPGEWELHMTKQLPVNVEKIALLTGDKALLDATVEAINKGGRIISIRNKDDAPLDDMFNCLMLSAKARVIPVTVGALAAEEVGGTGKGIPNVPLSDDYIAELGRQDVAIIYVALLEHFAGISLKSSIAWGGITPEEYKQILAFPSIHPDLTAQTIARVLTERFREFKKLKGAEEDHLIAMVEAVLHQRKLRNALALNNQLIISPGFLWSPGAKMTSDYGIKERGKSQRLLYDKWGMPVPEWLGYADRYYRTVDLNKIGTIKVSDPFWADMGKFLAQVFLYDNAEVVMGVAAMMKFYDFIAAEVYKQFRLMRVAQHVLAMLPVTIAFFVIHAVAAFLLKRGSPLGLPLLVAAKAVGWIMGVDFGLMAYRMTIVAGGHFSKMEGMFRVEPGEQPKTELTRLSLYHLKQGSSALLEVIYQAIAMGVFIAGGKLGGKAAESISKYVKRNRSEASYELTVDSSGNISNVKSLKASTKLEVPVEPVKSRVAKGTKTPTAEINTKKGGKIQVRDRDPIAGERGRGGGAQEKSSVPKPSKFAPVKDYLQANFRDIAPERLNTAKMEQTTGLPNEHLKIAMDIVNESGNIVLLRKSNPKGVQMAKEGGFPTKGKDLMFMNSDPATGVVTARNPYAAQQAMEAGYYIMGKDGRCYNSVDHWGDPAFALKVNGKTVQFSIQMKEGKPVGQNRSGQVIDPQTGKQILPDVDMWDVISPEAQRVNDAAMPKYRNEDVVGRLPGEFMRDFNRRLRELDVAQGRTPYDRVRHGGMAQWWQRIYYMNQKFKGDVIAIAPGGKIYEIPGAVLEALYIAIGRDILSLPSRRVQLPYKKAASK